MKYCVDIDNTICVTHNGDYSSSEPLQKRIDYINTLYNNGHTIIYFTARGSRSGIDYYNLTKQQLDNWGCLYHDLVLGKPDCDIFIDDKAINSRDFFNGK